VLGFYFLDPIGQAGVGRDGTIDGWRTSGLRVPNATLPMERNMMTRLFEYLLILEAVAAFAFVCCVQRNAACGQSWFVFTEGVTLHVTTPRQLKYQSPTIDANCLIFVIHGHTAGCVFIITSRIRLKLQRS
jgi:hypothetical protein